MQDFEWFYKEESENDKMFSLSIPSPEAEFLYPVHHRFVQI